MAIKISVDDLQNIPKYISDEKLRKKVCTFIHDLKDDYYFYGYLPLDVKYLRITITQLGNILTQISKKASSIHQTINEVYQAGFLTSQQSVFLYGRHRV